jgi:hypothetical protein
MTDDKKKTLERVKVSVRVRPITSEDLKTSGQDSIIEEANLSSGVITVKKDSDLKSFNFDTLFDESISQKQIYQKVGLPVVESVLNGYNSTVLAYGQTGTGKTFTMIGSSEQKGIIPRSVKQVFKSTHCDLSHSYSIKVAFMQLYNEVLQDLLKPNNPILIREDSDEGVFFSGLAWMDVFTVEDCMNFLSMGDKNRSIAFTNMNAQSSRSHAVFMVKIEKRLKKDLNLPESPVKKRESVMTKATLYLVDLAGSERVSKTKISGNRLDEAKNINLSLLALGNVIQALSDGKSKFIPFRDSKLTRILEQSLGGNSKTSMIVTIGPSPNNFQETLSSLQFAVRAMKIQNIPKVNMTIDYKALCSKLQAEIDKVNDNKNISNIELDKLVEENQALKERLERVTLDKDRYQSSKEKLEKILDGHKHGLDLSMMLGDSDESEKIKIYYRKKIEHKEDDFRKYSQKVQTAMSEKDEKILSLESRIQELEAINSSLSLDYRKLQEEVDKERIDKERLISEVYELKEIGFHDKDNFNKEIMRIIGKSNTSSVTSGCSSILLSSKIRSPIPSPRMIDINDLKAKCNIPNTSFRRNSNFKCEKCEEFLKQVSRQENIIENLENALSDVVDKYNNEYSNHRDTIIMYEKDKKDLKKQMAKLIKAYKKMERKFDEMTRKSPQMAYFTAR